MEYLQVLEAVRSVTGARVGNAFPSRDEPVRMLRFPGHSRAMGFVHDAAVAKTALDSPRYRQFNFMSRILSIADPEKTHWLRRFCDVGLIMIDGDEHLRRRAEMNTALEKCIHRLQHVNSEKVAATVKAAIDRGEVASSHQLAGILVSVLFAEAIAAILNRPPVTLPAEDLAAIDFFNPFPTLSSLMRSNAAIDRCATKLGLAAIDSGDQAAVLSLLIMGVTPMQAILAEAINGCVKVIHDGRSIDEGLAVLKATDAFSVVPTNFVMRECVERDCLAGVPIEPGDVIYVFLGTASGCPFSRHNSHPFGAGAHYCSGAKLTSMMLHVSRKALAAAAGSLGKVVRSPVVEGKAHAFLMHRDLVRPADAAQ